jgi:hypothetical protein
MPTVLRSGPYRFYFFSHEPNEPAHVHVDRERMTAKFWLEGVQLASQRGFADYELNRIERIAQANLTALRRAWYEHLGS